MILKLHKRIVAAILVTVLSLSIHVPVFAAAGVYTVKSGDTLWKISSANGLTVAQLKQYNSLTSDILSIGQKLTLLPAVKYTVKSGDTLWLIAQKYSTTVAKITSHNGLTSTGIYPNQVLYIPSAAAKPAPVLNWPSVTYTVQAGEYVSTIAKKFGVSESNILKYNYMEPDEWLNEGQKIAINGYAPRNYAVMPGESVSPARVGKLVDWFLDGKYLIKRNDTFLITDVQTGLQFKVKMLGGLNHSDVETLTANDTLTMKKLFPTWVWKPRPVVIFHDGINFAASLSGMPHSFDSIAANNVSGHFDLYLYHSTSHSTTVDAAYEQQHKDCVLVAAGMK
jgi:Predicted glycosyl hydrolase